MTPEQRAALCSTCGEPPSRPHQSFCARVSVFLAAELEKLNPYKTRCPKGHEYDDENTRVQRRPNGTNHRVCLACHRGNRTPRSDRGQARKAS